MNINLEPEHGYINYQQFDFGFWTEVTLWIDYRKLTFPRCCPITPRSVKF